MIKRSDLLEEFEKEQIRSTPPNYWRNLRILEALYQEARALGVFPLQDPLEGIEVDIEIARVINVRSAAGTDRSKAG